jgi:hypothetical protein|tara:strand:+ start:43 stop:267 length:225 start_codon:yes stop_codon:yes gene_type:complete
MIAELIIFFGVCTLVGLGMILLSLDNTNTDNASLTQMFMITMFNVGLIIAYSLPVLITVYIIYTEVTRTTQVPF